MKFTKILCFLLCVLLLLCSCQDTQNNGDETSSSGEDTTVEEKSMVDLSGYTVIYPSLADSSVRKSARDAVDTIKEMTGVTLEHASDWSAEVQENVSNSELEILVGETNRVETAQAKEKLNGDFTYVIMQTETKIVICGGSDAATLKALEKFLSIACENGKFAIEAGYLSVEDYMSDLYPDDSVAVKLAEEYTVIYPTSYQMGERKVSITLKNNLSALLGKEISVGNDKNAEVEKEILIGVTNRSGEDDSDLGYYDYRIKANGKKVFVVAGSDYALVNAGTELFRLIEANELKLDSFEMESRFDWDSANPIASDLSKFTPSWASTYTTPSWMLDFEEKTYAVTCPSNTDYRITIKAHRGDRANYPDCSLEGVASAILAGADCVEIDVRMTKDGIAVLMHDATLTRTTNVESFMGKTGYPNSSNVADWTYEQLQALSLVNDNGSQTDYKIPTLYETLRLCAGRIFIQVDDKSGELDIYDELYKMAEDTDSKECFFYFYGLNVMKTWASYDPADTEFQAYVDRCSAYLNESGHKLRAVYWPKDVNAYENGNLDETVTRWERMVKAGKMMIWTENVPTFSKYVSDHYQPTKK